MLKKLLKKIRTPKLNREQFAEAVGFHLKDIPLISSKSSTLNIEKTTFEIDEHLTIEAWWFDNSEFLHIVTYIDEIEMANYLFVHTSNIDSKYSWICREAKIIHYMPNQFIELMNNWSENFILDFKEKQDKIEKINEKIKKKKYDDEEEILKNFK